MFLMEKIKHNLLKVSNYCYVEGLPVFFKEWQGWPKYINSIMKLSFLFTILTINISCNKPSTIEVQNKLNQAKIKNVYWGEVPIAYEIIPDETSGKVRIYEDAHYNLDFPEECLLTFLLVKEGKELQLQSKQLFTLKKEDDLLIVIDSLTQVKELPSVME